MVDYICIERYGAVKAIGGDVKLRMDANLAVVGASVVVVEDIADHGLTLDFLQTLFEERRPASLRTCILFDKPARREVNISIDYAGLPVPDTFVIGYGLDHKELYRNLPYLAELREN
jgi:hypoxanthine phosphoribosyltransferase